MRSLFGVPRDTLLLVVLGLVALVSTILVLASVRNPLLPKLAWRNVPRRPSLAALITMGLTLGTIILSTSFTTGDTMSNTVRAVVAGALGAADEVVFVPAARQRQGFDLAQAIASGTLLTGISAYFPESEAARIQDLLAGDQRVETVLPAVLEQAPISTPDGGFRMQMNLMGIPGGPREGFGSLRGLDGRLLDVADLAPDEVFLNQEAANVLGVSEGSAIRIYGFGQDERNPRVKAVTRLGDLGGAQASVFFPLARLQALTGNPGQINQVLIVNRGTPGDRLRASWPLTVTLRDWYMDDATARRLYQAFSAPAFRAGIRNSIPHADGRVVDKLRQLDASLDAGTPTPEFQALAQDPEVLARVGSTLAAGRATGSGRGGGGSPRAAWADPAGPVAFRVLDVQQVAQDQAEMWGSAFTDTFVVLGLFSLFSGLLLIVLVFSLLALERRGELGILRALGGRRRGVVLLLAVEGGLYSLVSSLFGLGAGVAVALALVSLAGQFVQQYGFRLDPNVEPASLAVSYGIGVILTFATVTYTAWRASRFSIVTAIRDVPDHAEHRPDARSLILALLPLLAGVALVRLGLDRTLSVAYAAGVAVTIVGAALAARWLLRRLGIKRGERAVFSMAGLALVLWWQVPPAWLEVLRLPVFPRAVEMSFLSGMAMLLGAVWLLAYNVGMVRALRGGASFWRLSTAYVASNRFRTGMTLAMFGVVVLSLTLSAVLLSATSVAYGDPSAVTGGWDIRAESSGPPRGLRGELSGQAGAILADQLLAVGGTAQVQVEAIQPGASSGARWRPAPLLAIDQEFSMGAPTGLTASIADTRGSWRALAERPGTAVVGASLLRSNGRSSTRLQLEAREGAGFRPFTLWVRDARGPSQPAIRLEVIGIVDGRGPFGNQVLTGQQTLAAWPRPEQATYFVSIPPAANPREVSAAMNLSAPDLRALPMGEQQKLIQGIRGILNLILQGFMGIGLLSGVAALGVLSTRAVVERRRQIGVLRALGFRASMIGAGLLAEAGLVALLGAVLGVGVGLVVARGTVDFLATRNPELRFSIPWEQLGFIVVAALAASLLMTLLPARQAARLTPAEALRDA